MEEKLKELIEFCKEPYDGYDDDEGNYSSGYRLAMEMVIDGITEILKEGECK